jgi:NADPH:quinone reductase-like Zn-dependent oxidoreductase
VQAVSLNAVEVHSIATAQAGWRPGWDLAGVVEQAATDGSGPRVGTRVVGIGNPRIGTWAELVAVSTRMLAELPDEVTFAQAATLPAAGLTALFALERGGFLLNRKVLVTGASGGVGHFICQLARIAGAYVVASVRRPERVTEIQELGVHQVVVGEDIALAQQYGPYHLIIDLLGGKTLATALTLLAPGGHCVNLGMSESPEINLNLRTILSKSIHLSELFLLTELERPSVSEDLKGLAQLVASGQLRPQIDVEAPWTDVGEITQRFLDRRIAGKAVLTLP